MASNFYFIGGEDHDFTKNGTCSVNTATTAARRTANARCALQIGASSGVSDGWTGVLSAVQTSLWLTARVYNSALSSSTSYDFISLNDASGNRRVVIRNSGVSGQWGMSKRSTSGSPTTMVTSSTFPTTGALSKIDVFVAYGTSGRLDFYVDGTLIFSYTGDLTTDTTTSGIASFTLGTVSPSGTYWSEVICSDSDTRSMNLVTLAPSANGNAFTFDSGTVSNINEVTLDDTTLISSATAGELAQFTVGSSGITGNPSIKAVCVSARATKGGTGPQNAKLNVRTGGADYLSTAIALPAALGRIQNVFTTNPGTTNPWAYTDLTAVGFNVGVRSET